MWQSSNTIRTGHDDSLSTLLPGVLVDTDDVTTIPTGKMLHMALCCLEGSTMSNLVHRRRRCARIVLHLILCLEGSTPEDRGEPLHQAKDIVVAPGEPIFYCQRQLFCFLGA